MGQCGSSQEHRSLLVVSNREGANGRCSDLLGLSAGGARNSELPWSVELLSSFAP